tara:strand:+ start:2492 stop:3403 length:912 start_codon:yes stop_codon:yes gene_type:complete
MGFNLTSLTDYVNQEKSGLIAKSVLGATTLDYIRTISGIKSSQSINILDGADIVAQAGDCAFSPDGSTAITQVFVAVEKVKFNESYCLQDLEEYFTQVFMKPGNPEDMGTPTEALFVESKADNINSWLEKNIWQGDVATGGIFDGLLTYLAGAIDGNPSAATAITSANVIDLVDDMIALQPEKLQLEDDNRLFVSPAVFRLYVQGLVKANLYHYPSVVNGAAPTEMFVPGTNIKLTSTPGLTGSTSMVLSKEDNLVYGTDLLNEEEEFDLFYSRDNRDYRFISEFKAGTAVVFADEVVYFATV